MSTPTIILHGAIGSAQQMQAHPALAELDAHFYEFLGHGASAHVSTPYDLEHMADNLLQYLDSHFDEPVKVLGYSMGGYVALLAALREPQRFERIATLGTKFDWSVEGAQKEVRMLNPQKIAEKVPAFARALEQRHGLDHWKSVMERTAQMMLNMGAQPLLQPSDLSQVQTEVHVFVGAQDHMAGVEASAQFTADSQAPFTVIADCPHPIEQVSPEHLAPVISWLQS